MSLELSVKDNATQALKDKVQRFIEYAQVGMVAGMREFESYEIKNEMTGRPGLNRGSGALAQGWHIETEGKGLEFIVRMANSKSTFYAEVHQKGMTITARNAPYLHYKLPDGSYRRSTQVTIPKRLNIPENFSNMAIGYRMIHDHITQAMRQAGIN
jgi:hypothetical protein